jgi:PAS domain S-box-containing protein
MPIQPGGAPETSGSSTGGESLLDLKRRISIATLVILALVFVTTLLLVGMGLFNHYRESAQEREKLRLDTVTNADQLSAGLSLPLWNFDYSQVAKILDSAMQDPSVLGLVVAQSDPNNPGNLVTYARSRDEAWKPVNQAPGLMPDGTLVQDRQIVAMGEPIGRLKIYITTRFLDQAIRQRFISTMVLSLLFDLLLIVILYILLWYLVLKPLRAIERYALAVKAGGGRPEGFHNETFLGELESLRRSLGEMIALLQSRLNALLEKETTLRAVLDSVPQAVYWKDIQGRYLGCNKVFAQSAHLDSPEKVMGKHDLELPFHSDEITVHQMDDLDVLNTGIPKIHSIEPIQGQGGKTIWMDTTKVPILDVKGKPSAVLGVLEDITERKLAEEEHARLQEQLNQSQKLESIGRLAGGVAHDNNNMLTAILMHAELLKELLGPENPALRHITAMEGAAERSTGLIRQLLAFSRRQVIEPKVLNLNECLDGFKKSISPLIGEDIEFVLIPGENLWKIKMDPVQVDQIVMNLVVNARDAMPSGGALSIETSNAHLDDNYCQENPGAMPGDYVVLTVSDTGVGISAEITHKIFEPFFTTKEVGKGTGLGLSTVFGIVKQNNGFLNVYSEPSMGATFRIYLPRFTGGETQSKPAEFVANGRHGKGNILVVEDDETLREVIPNILDRLGYAYILADSPKDALRLCQQQETRIDLLLTDVIMPGMSGKELWDQIRVIKPEIRVVYMSGYPADVISRQGVLDSGVHFIQKPFSTTDLGKKLQSVMES